MKYLFVARTFTQFRNYDSVLAELARRGHRVHLAVERGDAFGGTEAVEALAAAHPEITCGFTPERHQDDWADAAQRLRLGLDYLRYLDPFYDAAPLRRERARRRTPRVLAALATLPVIGGAGWRRVYGRALHRLDAAVPPPPRVVEFVTAHAPDAVLITPLLELGSQQVDYLRAARLLRIPCAVAVWSWDHLTSKALLREVPERIFVWNETQRREAIEMHGVPDHRIIVTGAQCFDHWFDRRPERTRAEFCAGLGLREDRPIILYVCSGLIMGSPPEIDFVREWLQWVRGSGDPAVRNANVLIRPHPQQAAQWQEADLGGFGPIAVWGANPIDERTRADYFDSLFHSAAVVGLNTSAFLEAGIVGRDVLAILVPRFHDNQEGTAHFRYLTQSGGGLLQVARDRQLHVTQLTAALHRQPGNEHPHKVFLESFVRPRGLQQPATPVLVEAIEELPRLPIDGGDELEGAPERPPLRMQRRRRRFGLVARRVTSLLGTLAQSPRELDPERRRLRRERERELRDKRQRRQARVREHRKQKASKAAAKQP